MEKIKLDIPERLVILDFLPRLEMRGSVIEMIDRRHLLQKVDISIETKEKIGLKLSKDKSRVHWDPTKDELLEISITPEEKEIILSGIKMDHQKNQGSLAHASLFLKLGFDRSQLES